MALGLYIHYPYCWRVCPYCSFVVKHKPSNEAGKSADVGYVDALLKEIKLRSRSLSSQHRQLATIYFGGGTPSLMPVDLLAKIIKAIKHGFDCGDFSQMEVTWEVDPNTVNEKVLQTATELGVNRFSLGIQSFENAKLDVLRRGYTALQAKPWIATCASTVGNITLDMMYGLPDQSILDWRKEVDTLIEICQRYPQVKHLSLYNLTLEDRPSFLRLLHKHKHALPNDEQQTEMLRLAIERLRGVGFEHYEVTAFAKPGYQAKHNSSYWQGRSYLGLGVGAHSYYSREQLDAAPERFSNTANIDEYLQQLTHGQLPTYEHEILTADEEAFELLMLRLRQRRGMSHSDIEQLLQQTSSSMAQTIDRLIAANFLETDHDGMRLTFAGMMISNEIFSEFRHSMVKK